MAVTAQENIPPKFTEAHFEWVIYYLCEMPKNHEALSSKLLFKDGSEFYLMILRISETVYEVSVCLRCRLGKSIHCNVRFRDEDGNEHMAKGLHWHCVGDLSTILIKKLDTEVDGDMLLDDALTVLCDLSVWKDEDIPSFDSYKESALSRGKDLSGDLVDLLDGKKRDVVLYVKGTGISAHKEILRSRSSVFYAKLQHELMEDCSGVVEINDCDPDCFSAYLRYLYKGSFGSRRIDAAKVSSNNVVGLYWIADKYDAEELKKYCLMFITNNLSIFNFCDYYDILFMTQDEEKLRAAMNFLAKNMMLIVSANRWMSFNEKDPQRATNLLLNVLKTVTVTPVKK